MITKLHLTLNARYLHLAREDISAGGYGGSSSGYINRCIQDSEVLARWGGDSGMVQAEL